MCRTLTEGLICLNTVCSCRNPLWFYSYTNKKCEMKRQESGLCLYDDECRTDFGLKCNEGFCKCNSTTHIWTGTRCQQT